MRLLGSFSDIIPMVTDAFLRSYLEYLCDTLYILFLHALSSHFAGTELSMQLVVLYMGVLLGLNTLESEGAQTRITLLAARQRWTVRNTKILHDNDMTFQKSKYFLGFHSSASGAVKTARIQAF